MHNIINLHEYERAAEARLPRASYDYYASGAADELTIGANRMAFDALRLRPRVMVDVRERNCATMLFGQAISMPVLIAPMAFQVLAHPEGERATVRAANAAGIPMILSSLSTTALEEITAATQQPVWFQLYIYRDRGVTSSLVQRAEAAGCKAIVVTVDAPIQGKRERDMRNRFQLPRGVEMKNLVASGKGNFPKTSEGSALAAYINSQFDPSVTWADIEWLRSQTKLPVIVKGILRGDDAAHAVASGAEGIIVSNHGGRQLDTAIAAINALRDVVDGTNGSVPVMVDGGVRRGTVIVKALALGAQAVLLGRPVLWGLAVNGEEGVTHVLHLLREEWDIALALCGCRNVGEITRDLVA